MSNETTIIVVIGSVTAKQYKDVRLECLRLFGKPKIVRIHEDMFPGSYGFFDDEEVARRSGISSYEMDDEDAEILIRKELLERFGVDVRDAFYVVVSKRVAERFYDELDDDMGALQSVFFASEFEVTKN